MAAFILLFVTPISVIWDAFVLQKLWVWHAVPVFAVPEITTGQAIGIAMIATLLTHQRPRSDDSENEDYFARVVGWAALLPAMVLFIGWLAK